MEKMLVPKDIFRKQDNKPFRWKDLKHVEFEDEDVISVGYEEPYYTENNSHDGYYYAEVTRLVEETDEQLAKRIANIEINNKWAKERRYESYLKLKKEFEND